MKAPNQNSEPNSGATRGSFFVPHDIKAPISGSGHGPLIGLTAAVKDMYDIVGERTGGGNPDWLAKQAPARTHASAVARILDAGATITGKTICDEFFFSVTGANAHYGTPNNVRAPGRIPGGSSSGSAAATAAGACDFALGSDTGGSVRIPAALCGLYGIRPTHGRVDITGAMAMADSFDVVGWFASSPGLFRRIGPVLLGAGGVSAPIDRLILADDAFENADREVASVVEQVLAAAGPSLPAPSRKRVAPEGLDPWREAFRVIQGWEIWQIYGSFIEQSHPRLGPGVKERLAYASSVKEPDAKAARAVMEAARKHVRTLLPPGTILALPTAPSIAPLIDTTPEDLDAFRVRVMRLTCIAGMSGLPQVTIPIGTVSGCPVGLSFIGWAGGDEALLDLAVTMAKWCGQFSRTQFV
ncbi:MAG TPA: amidase [Xanthobacteraceae bacterium]|jgi:amidase|nr:amidase [Xanthobacteraceae bacterium]